MDGFSLSHPVPIILRAKWDQATRRVFPSFLFSRLYDSLNRRVISFSYLFSFPLTCHFFSFIIIDWWHGERWDRETGSGESRTKERDEWVREANGRTHVGSPHPSTSSLPSIRELMSEEVTFGKERKEVTERRKNGWVSLSSRVNESERKERANPSIKRVEPKGAVRDEALHGKVLCL